MSEQRNGETPSAVDVADHPVGRDPGLVEEDLVELGGTRHLDEWTNGHAGLVHRQGEHRDPAVFGCVEVGAGQEDAEVRDVGLRGPHLLSGDDPLVAVTDRTGREPGEIGSGPGLGEELAPDLLAAQGRRDESLLEFIRGVVAKRRHDHAETQAEERVLAGQEFQTLVTEGGFELGGKSGAPEVRRIRDAGQAGIAQGPPVRLAPVDRAVERSEDTGQGGEE